MRVIKVKNLQEEMCYYGGVGLDQDEYHEITCEQDRHVFMTDKKLIEHLFSTPPKALINNGDEDINDPFSGEKWLFCELDKVNVAHTPTFAAKTTEDGQKLFRRKHGFPITVPANDSVEVKFNVPYTSTKITEAEIVGGVIGDKVDFKVYDTPEGTISTYPNIMLNQFGFGVYISSELYRDKSQYDADLIEDMKVGVTYYNSSEAEITVYVNLTLHEVV